MEQDVFLRSSEPISDQPTQVAHFVLKWLDDNIPYSEDIYTADEALKRGGGNCYARTMGGVALLSSMGIPSGVVLTKQHAHIVFGMENKLLFVETAIKAKPLVRNPVQEALFNNHPRLTLPYATQLQPMFRSGDNKDFSIYFEAESTSASSSWIARQVDNIRTGRRLRLIPRPHIIVDGKRGADMLKATGDLMRYRETRSNKYEENYERLIPLVPDFIKLPPPETRKR